MIREGRGIGRGHRHRGRLVRPRRREWDNIGGTCWWGAGGMLTRRLLSFLHFSPFSTPLSSGLTIDRATWKQMTTKRKRKTGTRRKENRRGGRRRPHLSPYPPTTPLQGTCHGVGHRGHTLLPSRGGERSGRRGKGRYRGGGPHRTGVLFR